MSLASRSRRILILDDAPAVAETLGIILSRQGHDAKVAQSAEAAIELIADWQPDLAVIDVMLPGMNGIDFSKVLKANHPGCEIILFSGHPGSAELAEISRGQGQVLAILAKPLDPEIILAIASRQSTVAKEQADAN